MRSIHDPPDATIRYRSDLEYLRSKVPSRDATVAADIGAPVALRWDDWGIPHIRAERRRDLFVGLGYATAQECLWRLEHCRRLARGELAAVLGRGALPSDRTMRLLGLGRHADELARELSEDVAEALDGLAAGINRWIEHAAEARTLPVEFDWLGYAPAPWTPADSIACWKHRWWTLTGRLDNLAAGEAARRHLPPDLLAAFMATELGEETIVPDAGSAGGAVPGGSDNGEGSNNWAVAGSRTTTGYPVLCSDPHNPFTQPGQWFQAQLTLTDGPLDVLGAIYAGTPGVYLGRNRHVAWGFTNHVAAVRDLYLETVDPGRPGMYLEAGSWRPFDLERHTLEVRGEAAEAFEVHRTVRGPVVNALLPELDGPGSPAGGLGEAPRDPTPISLRWTGTEVGTGFDALLGLNAAATVGQALDALAAWPCPILNAVLADDRGDIAYHVVGRVPRRVEAARRYRSADDPADAWQGFIAFEDLPRMTNPARGWIASANQPPWRRDPPGLSYLAGAAWADGGRMRRIRKRLTVEAADRKLSPAEVGAVQADVTSERAVELVPALLRMLETAQDDAARRHTRWRGYPARAPAGPRPTTDDRRSDIDTVVALLRAWDGRFSLDSAAASVWAAFWERWQHRVAAARFPGHLVSLAQGQAGAVARRLLLGHDTSPPWLPDGNIPSHVSAALAEALGGLARRFGAAPEGWRWGALHTVTWRHALSEQGPPEQRRAAAALFDVGPFPTTGTTGTVRAAGQSQAHPFEVISGSTYRLVADLSPGGGMVTTTTTGNSGHPGSPHYADQARLWLADQYHPFPMDDFAPKGVTTITPSKRD